MADDLTPEREALMKLRLHNSLFWDDEWGSVAKIASTALDKGDAVPEGFVVVPKEPTDAMVEAAIRTRGNTIYSTRFMLRAAIAACEEESNG